jgi:hypothetical protein
MWQWSVIPRESVETPIGWDTLFLARSVLGTNSGFVYGFDVQVIDILLLDLIILSKLR